MATTTKNIQDFYHKLLELQAEGITLDIDSDSRKNYASYTLSRTSANAKYEDCLLMYCGDKGEENACLPEDIPIDELMNDLNDIVFKIQSVFA